MKKQLTIAFYCSSLSWGGLEMNILKRARWMAERGHITHLFCVENSPIHKEAVLQTVQVTVVNRNKKSFDLSNALKVKRLLKSLNISCLWFADKRDLSLVFLVKVFMGSKLSTLYQQSMQIGVNKKQWWQTVRFKRIDHWICPLHYLKEQLNQKTHFPVEKVKVIPQGMDIESFLGNLVDKKTARVRFNLREEDVVVGMIGRIDVAKAQQFVKEVVAKMMADNSRIKLLFVGNKTEGEWDEYYAQFREDILDNASDNAIQMFPFMADVEQFYSAIDIFVMASKNETYGMVTIEAMLAQKVIVGTNSAGTKELLAEEENGYYFDWMNAESLKNALAAAISDPVEANRRAANAKNYALANFSFKDELSQIEELLQGE